MSLSNVLRLKKKVGFKKNSKDVNKYFELIDLIYYSSICFQEDYDEEKEITTWSFENGKCISLESWELFNLALFMLDLSNKCESEMKKEDVKEYFLEEKHWEKRK
jgi:hypothetical protein